MVALGGAIYGPYTATTFRSTRETDIEHIVARSEAQDKRHGTRGKWRGEDDRQTEDI